MVHADHVVYKRRPEDRELHGDGQRRGRQRRRCGHHTRPICTCVVACSPSRRDIDSYSERMGFDLDVFARCRHWDVGCAPTLSVRMLRAARIAPWGVLHRFVAPLVLARAWCAPRVFWVIGVDFLWKNWPLALVDKALDAIFLGVLGWLAAASTGSARTVGVRRMSSPSGRGWWYRSRQNSRLSISRVWPSLAAPRATRVPAPSWAVAGCRSARRRTVR